MTRGLGYNPATIPVPPVNASHHAATRPAPLQEPTTT